MTTLLTTDEPRPTPPARTAFLLGLLLVIDTIVVGQGFISLLVAIIGTVVLLLATAVAAFRKQPLFVRYRLIRAGIYFGLGVATIGVMRLHLATGERGAKQIIAACRAYRSEKGSFPDDLRDLVPRFLKAIPTSRYTLSTNNYMYIVTSADKGESYHTLVYVVIPPFGRRTYSLERDRWGSLD